MNSNFLITIHNFENSDSDEYWSDIDDFIKIIGKNALDFYFNLETQFISVINSFNDYFSKNEYFDSLATKIEVYEYDSNFNFYGLDGDYKRLKVLGSLPFSSISDVDREFIYRCQCRRMCSFWFIDVSSMSYIHSGMDPFYLFVHINSRFSISEIFKKTDNIFYYYDKDNYNMEEDYDLPSNYRQKLDDF